MIAFYPRELALWGDHFDFHPPITLVTRQKTDHQVFYNREELIEFLKGFGVRLDDPKNPLKFEKADESVYDKGYPRQGELFVVVQWSVLGWFRDDYK